MSANIDMPEYREIIDKYGEITWDPQIRTDEEKKIVTKWFEIRFKSTRRGACD